MDPMNVICFSHLRWDFVYQRPQHVMSRCAKMYSVFFVEEAVFTDEEDGYTIIQTPEGVRVIKPHLHAADGNDIQKRLEIVIAFLLSNYQLKRFIFWYYTPMALEYTQSFGPELIIYDCMDELSAFKFAPVALKNLEAALMEKADLVFTGGRSLYEVRKDQHESVYLFPSSIDKAHFGSARSIEQSPSDQQIIPGPRFGFFGVIDERLDIELLKKAAELKPEWSFVMIGPIVKINPKALPRSQNIHFLGQKNYQELPAYLSGWDVALIPFALNESTRYISPTKTPEYLAAGKPVISTAIADVVEPYGSLGLVYIINSADELIARGEEILKNINKDEWLEKVDDYLAYQSWDITWYSMNDLIQQAWNRKQIQIEKKRKVYV